MGTRRKLAVAVLVAVAALAVLVIRRPAPPAATPSAPLAAPPIPKIDVHVHVPVTLVPSATRLFASHGIRLALNASGGHPGERLQESARAGGAHLRPYCFVDWRQVGAEDWSDYARETLAACREQGAVGFKIFKALGLGIVLQSGELLPVDDPMLDVVFEEAGRQRLPVLIHSGDPRAFFEPPTPDNERYDELEAHPSWSFYGPRPDGGRWPSWREVLGQFERRVARHPGTTFVGAHFGNAPEDPDFVARMLEAYPHYFVETGARIPEIGRHDPARMRRFFIRFQDRILFGTDFQVVPGGFVLGSSGTDLDTLAAVPRFFEAHWRYFETADRGFAHPTPIQGAWTIDGIGLPREVLEKIYYRNAERVFGVTLPPP